MKKKIIPNLLAVADLHQIMLGSIAPRPIAFVSTIDSKGNQNLAPYSFFNAFSSNPPILVFSSNRRVDGNTTKDTLHNIQESMECVINVVNHSIVRQMMLCSVDFPHEMSEFKASGLTPTKASMVSAPLVKESPVSFECKVKEIITLGENGGAGHLIICHVECIHLEEDVLDENGRIDPHKIDLMGRMGRAFYVRASGDAVFAMPQTQTLPVVTYPNLPEHVRKSDILSANDIGYLAGLKYWPNLEEAHNEAMKIEEYSKLTAQERTIGKLHKMAKQYFLRQEFDKATVLLASI
jgi:flavin reductase (DIM6/NTAB) family NADH-FMN oxidoreductase RutF